MIVSLMRAMLADYPTQYRKSYPDEKTASMLKSRLEAKMAVFHPSDVIDGYEQCIDENPRFMPTIPDLIGHIKNLTKTREEKTKGNIEAERIAALPAPTIDCNPLDMLKKAQSAIDTSSPDGMEEWKKRMHGLKLHNNKLTASMEKRYAAPHQLCNVNGCSKAGALTSSVRGSESWYCSTHFAMS